MDFLKNIKRNASNQAYSHIHGDITINFVQSVKAKCDSYEEIEKMAAKFAESIKNDVAAVFAVIAVDLAVEKIPELGGDSQDATVTRDALKQALVLSCSHFTKLLINDLEPRIEAIGLRIANTAKDILSDSVTMKKIEKDYLRIEAGPFTDEFDR